MGSQKETIVASDEWWVAKLKVGSFKFLYSSGELLWNYLITSINGQLYSAANKFRMRRLEHDF